MNKKLNLSQYQKLAKRTARKFDDPEKEIMTWGLGLAGEAGDVAGCIKKTYTHRNDQTLGIRENLGDTMWYMTAICNFYGWSLEEILAENIKKLKKRLPKGFRYKDIQRKNTRVDWNEK